MSRAGLAVLLPLVFAACAPGGGGGAGASFPYNTPARYFQSAADIAVDVYYEPGGNATPGIVRRFVEQSTIVHELGHALGFVNNGVPMVTNHQDVAHGRHTTDDQCVMYYLNEGTADLIQFFQRFLTSHSLVMWGSAVRADAQAFSR